MSQKNHKMTDGKLLQTDKKYAQLKLKQKEKIAEWMFQVTRDYYTKNYTFPNDRQIEKVVNIVYEKIEEAEIWVPYGEVLRHYKSKRSAINRRVRKELNEKEENRNEKVCFMNMCMVQDDKGNVLALDKVNDSYTGTTFPGGHVEQNEIFQKSIIREVWEETGLTIESPKLCGLYHWHEDGVHSVIMLYKPVLIAGPPTIPMRSTPNSEARISQARTRSIRSYPQAIHEICCPSRYARYSFVTCSLVMIR